MVKKNNQLGLKFSTIAEKSDKQSDFIVIDVENEQRNQFCFVPNSLEL